MTIIISGQETAASTDILQGTRLQSAPSAGFLTFELQASDNDATNAMSATIQLPGGDTPLNGVRIPCGNTASLAGVIDSRTCITATFAIAQGGHCTFSVADVNGTGAILSWRVTFSPAPPVVVA